MKPPIPRRRSVIAFNLTPMIDVVFNLIIFFLVASHFSRTEENIDVNLPRATQGSDEMQQPRRLTITISAQGAWTIGGAPRSLEDIERQIREAAGDRPETFAVHLRGDRSAPFAVVEPLLLACARAGVTHVQTHVEPR